MADNDQRPWTKTERGVLWMLLLLLVALAITVAVARPPLIRFRPLEIEDFTSVIVPLFLVALFIERAVEVFLTSWRATDSETLEKKAKEKEPDGVEKPASVERQELSRFKGRTRIIAFTSGTLLGIIAAALGFRVLEPFLHADWSQQPGVTPFHAGSFQAFDAILTGLVIGGGADGMHKLVLVFTNFMDAAAKKAKNAGGR